MRPINVTLDAGTWELAKQKVNFSEWVRKQLLLEKEGKSIGALEDELEATHKRSEGWYHRYIELCKDREVKE